MSVAFLAIRSSVSVTPATAQPYQKDPPKATDLSRRVSIHRRCLCSGTQSYLHHLSCRLSSPTRSSGRRLADPSERLGSSRRRSPRPSRSS